MGATASVLHRDTAVEDFIRQVKAALKRQQMGVKELSDECGVSREYIHRILSGQHNPSLDIAVRIAKPLGLTLQTVADK